MNSIDKPGKLRGFEQHIKVENVSRRSVLKGLGIAGGFVLAAPVMSRQALAAYETGAGKMPHGVVVDPARVRRDRTRRHRHHPRAPLRDGHRRAHQPAAGRRRRDGGRLVARAGPAGAMATRVKYGNQDTDGSRSTRHYLIPMRQIGASARTMLEQAARQALGRAGDRGQGRQPRGRPQRAAGRKLGFGELAADAASAAGAEHRRPEAEGPARTSAISARARSASSISTTSPPARRATAPTCGSPA